MASTHHIEVADWYSWDFSAIEAVGLIPRAGGVTVDYDTLSPEAIFQLELQPQLVIDSRDYAERVGNPEYRRNMPLRGESPSATNVMLPLQPQTVSMVDPNPPAPRVY